MPIPSRADDVVAHYNLYRDYVKHEDELINRRLSWNLTLQGFLFAAYGVSLQVRSNGSNESLKAHAKDLAHIFPAVGAAVGLFVLLGVLAAQLAIFRLEKTWKSSTKNEAVRIATLPGITGAGSGWARWLGFIAHFLIPIVIIGAWIWVLRIQP